MRRTPRGNQPPDAIGLYRGQFLFPMKRPYFPIARTIAWSAILAVLPALLSAQRLLLHYDFNGGTAPYPSVGELDSPLTPRGDFQSPGADGSGVSGRPGDRAWDASANTSQGNATPANNAALTTPAPNLDLNQLTGFTIAFWFKTEQSLNGDSATRLVYKANTSAGEVAQGFTLRSLSGRLELRIRAAGSANVSIISSLDFGSGSGYNKVNSWIFVAFTWDGSTIQYYCGGPDYSLVLAGSGPFSGPIVNNIGNLVIGNAGSFNRGLDGWVDNFRFYDGALTKAELEALRLSDAGASAERPVGGPIRPLAPDFAVIGAGESGMVLGAAQIARLSSGRLVASYEERPVGTKDDVVSTIVSSSDDGGINWTPRARLALGSARLFATSTGVHALGVHDGLIVIARSTDTGTTWSMPTILGAEADWQRSTGNVWQTADHVAVALMQRAPRTRDGWTHADFAPVLLRASVASDLTQPGNWTRSSAMALADVFDKFSGDVKPGRFFGVPFRQPSAMRDGDAFQRQALAPVGWFDANVVQILDASHYWHGADTPTWHIFARGQTGGSGFSALMKIVQQTDGALVAAPEVVPSGKRAVFLPLPGGQNRFDIRYDEISGLYWLLSVLPGDSMRRPDRGGNAADDHVLTVHFSRNLVDWGFAALVADNSLGEVADAAMQIDNLDLGIVSRTRATAGQTDLITFRRLRNFRDLAY